MLPMAGETRLGFSAIQCSLAAPRVSGRKTRTSANRPAASRRPAAASPKAKGLSPSADPAARRETSDCYRPTREGLDPRADSSIGVRFLEGAEVEAGAKRVMPLDEHLQLQPALRSGPAFGQQRNSRHAAHVSSPIWLSQCFEGNAEQDQGEDAQPILFWRPPSAVRHLPSAIRHLPSAIGGYCLVAYRGVAVSCPAAKAPTVVHWPTSCPLGRSS